MQRLYSTENMTTRKRAGHQARTEATKEIVLSAAIQVFLRDGYERAELETIAEVAGRTKGSIYAHFKNKEDLFLAIYEKHVRAHIDQLFTRIEKAKTPDAAIKRLHAFLGDLIRDKTWPLLALEFRLYSLRHPEARERWTPLNTTIWHSTQEVLLRRLYGKPSASRLTEINAGLAAIGPVLIALILESQFQPELLTDERIAKLMERLLPVLIDVS